MKRSLALIPAVLGLLIPVSHVYVEPVLAQVPPCEAKTPITTPPPPSTPVPTAPQNLRIVGGGGEDVLELLESPLGGPRAGDTEEFTPGAPQTSAAHAYFEALASRPDCSRAFSLRSAAQVEQYRTARTRPSNVSYDPARDPDPRRQDGMKIVIPATNNSLGTQVWVPTGHTPRTNLLVTFDAWWGREYAFSSTGIPTHKSWQIGSPNADIWTELQLRFGLAQNDASKIAWTDIRQYGDSAQGPNVTYSPVFNGRSYGSTAIGPMVGDFAVAPETWTRFWVFFDLQPDGQWYRMSMWVADETRNPVRVYDGLQITPRKGPSPIQVSMDGVWGNIRVEYNTSHSTIAPNRVDLISYARNIVTLTGTTLSTVQGLLQRPQR